MANHTITYILDCESKPCCKCEEVIKSLHAQQHQIESVEFQLSREQRQAYRRCTLVHIAYVQVPRSSLISGCKDVILRGALEVCKVKMES